MYIHLFAVHSGSSSMSDQFRGLLVVLRRGEADWSSFSRDRIRAAFLLSPGVGTAPLVVKPIEEIAIMGSDEDVSTPSIPPPSSSHLDRRLSRRYSSFRSPQSRTRSAAAGTSRSVPPPLLDVDETAVLPVTLSSDSQGEPEVCKRTRTQSSRGETSNVAPSSLEEREKKRKLQEEVDGSFKAPVEPRPSGSRPLFFYSLEEKEAYSKVYEVNSKVFC